MKELALRMLTQIRQRGWLYVSSILLSRMIPQWLLRFRYFHVYELKQLSSMELAETDPQLTIMRCTERAQIEAAERVTKRNHSDTKAARETSSHDAWIALLEDEVVGALWMAKQHFEESELGIRYRLGDCQLWMYSSHVLGQRRRQGIYTRLLSSVLQDAKSKRVYAAINPVNVASMAAHRRFLASDSDSPVPVGRCVAIRFLGLATLWCNGVLRADRAVTFRCQGRPIEISIAS